MIRFQSPCVTPYLPIQNPLVNVTSTCASTARRSGSSGGLPILNRPAGHQQSLTPPISRSSPACEPRKERLEVCCMADARFDGAVWTNALLPAPSSRDKNRNIAVMDRSDIFFVLPIPDRLTTKLLGQPDDDALR